MDKNKTTETKRKNCDNKNHESSNDYEKLDVLNLGLSNNQVLLHQVIESEFLRFYR